jgi:hypothetical protein
LFKDVVVENKMIVGGVVMLLGQSRRVGLQAPSSTLGLLVRGLSAGNTNLPAASQKDEKSKIVSSELLKLPQAFDPTRSEISMLERWALAVNLNKLKGRKASKLLANVRFVLSSTPHN